MVDSALPRALLGAAVYGAVYWLALHVEGWARYGVAAAGGLAAGLIWSRGRWAPWMFAGSVAFALLYMLGVELGSWLVAALGGAILAITLGRAMRW